MGNETTVQDQLAETLAQFRALGDRLREDLKFLEGRIVNTLTTAPDAEVAYTELWLKQIRDAFKEIDQDAGRVRQLNWKRAAHLWFNREDKIKLYDHTFSLSFHFIPSLPKERTAERARVIAWLKAGNRLDCLVMDEGTGEWVFDFKKIEQLVNQMLEAGQRPPDEIKLHPQVKISCRASK